MPQPDVGDVHTNALLSQISVGYTNPDNSYVADRVFPLVYVDKQSDLYPIFNRGDFIRDEGTAMVRAPGTNAAVTGYGLTTGNYFALNYAIGHEIPDELRGNADSVYDLDMQGTFLVTNLQLIRRERAFATDFMKTGVWTGSSTGSDITVSNKWSDYGASDPIGDIRTQLRAGQLLTGRRPNKLVMGQIVWDRLIDHPDFIDRIKGGATTANPAFWSQQALANLLGLDEILVGSAVYNAAQEGLTAVPTFIMDDDALLLYTPSTAGKMIPSAGYTFVWQTLVNGARSPQYIRKIREERPRKDIIEAHSYWDQAAVDVNAGCFFPDVVD